MNYTENLSLGLPEYGESADVAALNRNSGILDAYVYNTRQIECEPYDSTKTYMSGDLAIHNEVIYECNTDNTTGTWDDSKWDSTTLAEQIAKAKQMGGESALADLEDVEITNPSTGQALLFDDDDDVWKNQNLPDVSVTKEASGNPVEFSDGADAPLVKCVTEIQGSQDLHGYDKPWVGGAGKNKFNKDGTDSTKGYIYNRYLMADGTEMQPTTGTWFVSEYIPILPSTQYTLSGLATTDSNAPSIIQYNSSKNRLSGEQYSNRTSVTFTSYSQAEYVRISVNDEQKDIMQFEQGGTATTYSPYSNICPITAYTEGEIEVSDGDGNVTTHTTTFPSAIYRGSEDVVNGTETHDTVCETITSRLGGYTDSVTGLYLAYLKTGVKAFSDNVVSSVKCDRLETVTANYQYNNAGNYIVVNANGIIYVSVVGCTSAALFDAWLANNPLQVAYELATPTTSSVTPTNLPIKSLSGYNHIESSTGDVEIEYITQNYQPLVDLIQSGNGHTYSTSEQVVGKWIDGRPIYERTFEVNNITSDGVQTLDATGTPSNIQMVPGCSVVMRTRGTYNTDYGVSIASEQSGCRLISNSNGLGVSIVGYAMFTSQYGTCTVWALVRYVKASDAVQTRSINAPLTSQKAQIEHLTDKTEEVPTEEEKAVNEEENTNENR